MNGQAGPSSRRTLGPAYRYGSKEPPAASTGKGLGEGQLPPPGPGRLQRPHSPSTCPFQGGRIGGASRSRRRSSTPPTAADLQEADGQKDTAGVSPSEANTHSSSPDDAPSPTIEPALRGPPGGPTPWGRASYPRPRRCPSSPTPEENVHRCGHRPRTGAVDALFLGHEGWLPHRAYGNLTQSGRLGQSESLVCQVYDIGLAVLTDASLLVATTAPSPPDPATSNIMRSPSAGLH